ncbi:MAG: glycosyltransferase [Planctomycetaceae bacterium]|nr:glycosyltransferase [Planctomycetaceae bacterium]
MDTFAFILTCIVGVCAGEWLVRNLLALPVWRRTFHLQHDWDAPQTPTPPLSVVVAAKDEEANIETCVRTMLDQDYPDYELIVVNDRSSDRTGEIVRQIAATDKRLTLIEIDRLGEGWCGKNHAMYHGIKRARGEWILMTDADCRQASRRTLSLSMAFAQSRGADLLSLLPALELESFWEKLLQPVCVGVLMVWFRPDRVNNPKKPQAYANGMFMLMRRAAYDAIGGHEAIKGSLIEDMDMARRIKRSGMTLCMVPSEGLFHVRMYTTLGQILRGWNRIFFGAFRSFWRVLLAFCVLAYKGLTCYIAAALGLGLHAAGAGEAWRTLGLLGLAGSVVETIMVCRYYVYTKSKWYLGLIYPFSCAWVCVMLLRSLLMYRRSAKLSWRDTIYTANSSPDALDA